MDDEPQALPKKLSMIDIAPPITGITIDDLGAIVSDLEKGIQFHTNLEMKYRKDSDQRDAFRNCMRRSWSRTPLLNHLQDFLSCLGINFGQNDFKSINLS